MSGNNININNDDAFIRQYAAQIAQALREQEETPRQESVEASLPVLYRSLCFDEPMLDDTLYNLPVVASALSRQLLSKSSPFALSNRLVNGVVYMCQQRSTSASASSRNGNNSGSNNATENSNTNTPSTTTASSVAMAKLAFCVLILMPLECCQEFEHLETIKQYLGSYKGSIQQQEQKETETETTEVKVEEPTSNDTTQKQVEQLAQALNGTHVAENNGDDPFLQEEVWAAESDPSDYDFGEGIPEILPQQEQHIDYEDWVDPHVLSKADPSLTREQARSIIGSLLQQANYTLLEPIFATTLSKKDVDSYISQLTQLLLVLLQPQNMMGGDNVEASLQTAILSPLWILRDAALHSSQQQQQHYTTSYLEVVQTLLAVDQAHLQDMAGHGHASKKIELCSASIVGLSALSSWCSMAKISSRYTIPAIIDSMNDLAHVVERATENYKENLTHSLVPILELLTGITLDHAKTTPSPNATTIAQALLNSGLLRQLLALALEEKEERRQHHFHHALWGLCVAYPKIVGKYVARYPGISQLVRQYYVQPDSSSRDCVHSILWNGYGWTQCEDASQQSQAPRVVWKTKSSSQKQVPPLSKDECREVCEKSWARLCQTVETSVRDSPNNPKEALAVLDDWERLLMLAMVPSMASAFASLVDPSQVKGISNMLPTLLQQQQGEEESNIPPVVENDKDDSEDPDKKKSSTSKQQMVVSKTRKLLKQYTLFFQGNMTGTSKTD